MTSTCATIIGIVLQVLGTGYLVAQAWLTSRKLGKYRANVTFDTLGPVIDTLAHELSGQFRQQTVGFVFFLIGAGFQLYASIAT